MSERIRPLDSFDDKNAPEPSIKPMVPSLYTGLPRPLKCSKKGVESCKWHFQKHPGTAKQTAKRNLKGLIDAECESCSDCVRKCDVMECPLWQYRSKACKVHRGWLERLRKPEFLSDEELEETQKLYEAEDRAMRRVLDMVLKHCPSKVRAFIAAYGGKSRASAIKAYEVWMANYDLTMVEPLEAGEQQ
jgi:hypothetical protein